MFPTTQPLPNVASPSRIKMEVLPAKVIFYLSGRSDCHNTIFVVVLPFSIAVCVCT